MFATPAPDLLQVRLDPVDRAAIQSDACHSIGQVSLEPYDSVPCQPGAGCVAAQGSATQRDHTIAVAEHIGDGQFLQGAKGGLAIVGENFGDGLARPGDNHIIDVGKRASQPLRQRRPHGRLPRTRHADQDNHQPLPSSATDAR